MEKLALLGGKPAITIDYNKYGKVPLVADAAYRRIDDILHSGDLSFHPIVNEFETKFAEYVGAKYSVCTVNCTSALQAALFAVGVGAGDEVIVPSFTFWATAGPIYANHAIPVFCDIDKETHNIDPNDIEHRITERTKAIMVVHVWGNPVDMDRINSIAKKHNLKVIEDCAHAHGTKYKGKSVGTLGDVGCFSFQNSKVLPAGEGGIAVTNNLAYMERILVLAHYDKISTLPKDSDYLKYSMTGFGFKHRMHPLAAAVALSNLERLDCVNAARTKYGQKIDEALSNMEGFVFQKVLNDCERIYAYHYIYFDSSKWGISLATLLEAVAAEGAILGTCGYGFLHLAPAFKKRDVFGVKSAMNQIPIIEDPILPVTDDVSSNTFMLPRFEVNSEECDQLVDQYILAFKKAAYYIDELREYESKRGIASVSKGDGRSITIFKLSRKTS